MRRSDGSRRDPVREFLESVQNTRFEQNRCHRKVMELDAQCQSITAQLSGMPGGGSGDKHKDGPWAALADLRVLYLRRCEEAQKQEKLVEEFISSLKDPNHRAVLMLRYVDLLQWPQVEQELARCGIVYSDRQIYRIHGEALQAARIQWEHLRLGEGA